MIDKLKGFSTVTNWYYGIMSLLYLVVSIKPMSVLVDTVWFRKMAYKFSFPYVSVGYVVPWSWQVYCL